MQNTQSIYIANPIYDTVFKYLMENQRVARYFVETIIDYPVESIQVAPQEYTWFKPLPEVEIGSISDEYRLIELLSIIRYDFVAIIRTPQGPKKVLIELQKAKNDIDLMRFRTYLGEQYKRKNKIEVGDETIEEPLPVITIYLLGFTLPETDAIVIHVSRTYIDVIKQQELHIKSKFIECLTHDSYVVQIPHINGKARTRLEKMLTVFEQSDFYDEKCTLKQYQHETDDEDIRLMIEILYHIGADPKKREEIEIEWRSYELWLMEIISRDHKIDKQNKTIEEKHKTIEEKDKTIEEKDKIIEEKDKNIEEKDKTIEEKDKTIEEKDKTIEEKDKMIEVLQQQLLSQSR